MRAFETIAFGPMNPPLHVKSFPRMLVLMARNLIGLSIQLASRVRHRGASLMPQLRS